jgi:SAM-dependent methyltransferase
MERHEASLKRVREYSTNVDFGHTAGDYARFRPGPPASFYDRLNRIAPLRGSRVVDAACGVGWVALEAAARGSVAVGFDTAEEQVAAARRLASERGLTESQARFFVASAEQTGLPDGSFDLYIASQSWHWFDRPKAAAEARRIVRPGGIVVVCSFDYLSRRSPVARVSEELILKYNPTWPMAGGSGCHVGPLFDLPEAGFVGVEQFSYEHLQPFTHEAWRGRMRTCNGVGASLTPERVEAYDRDLAEALAQDFPVSAEGTIGIWHRVWVVWAGSPKE